jgi:DNA-binding transcriptional LysR family regulator
MNTRALDLNLLVAFEALMLERSVSKAGARLGLSQPAMSNALERLRGALGDRLFVQHGRQMVPTARSHDLAVPVLESLANIRAAIGAGNSFDASRATASFRLAATDYVEIVFLPRALRALKRAAPHVSLTVSRLDGQFEVPAEKLHDGRLHLALGLFPQPLAPGGGMAAQPLFDDPWVCIVRAHHPQIRGKLSLATFLRLEHIRVAYAAPERPGLIAEALATLGKSRRVGLTVPHLATVPALVASSDLLGIVPARLASQSAKAFGLRIYPLPLRLPRSTVALLWHESKQHDPAHCWLRGMLARLASEKAA